MKAKQRRRARKLAFQAVFMLDARREWDLALARQFFARSEPEPPTEIRDLALRLVATVAEHRETVDIWLDAVHPRWQLTRMRAEDRAALRCGVAEIWFHCDVPPNVAINEWIEVAKVFGGDESPRFVNGILDRAARERPEPQ